MTLIVCLKNAEGIILAGDKRAVHEDSLHSYNDKNIKVFKINERVGIAAAGDADDVKPVLTKILSTDYSAMDIEEVANNLYTAVIEYQSNFISKMNPLLKQLGYQQVPNYVFIIAGYTHKGEQRIYSLNTQDIRLTQRETPYQEGITEVARQVFVKEYKQDMTLTELQKLAEQAIQKTSEQSYAVSSCSDFVTITHKS